MTQAKEPLALRCELHLTKHPARHDANLPPQKFQLKHVVLVGSTWCIRFSQRLETKTKSIGPLVLHWDLRKLLMPHSLHEVLANDWVSTHMTKNIQNLQSHTITTMPQKAFKVHGTTSSVKSQPLYSRCFVRVGQEKCTCLLLSLHLWGGVWGSHRLNFTTISQVQHVFFSSSCSSWKFLVPPCIQSSNQSWAFLDEESTQDLTVLAGSYLVEIYDFGQNLRLGHFSFTCWCSTGVHSPAWQTTNKHNWKHEILATLATLATYLDVFPIDFPMDFQLACTAQPDSKRGIRRTGDSPGSTG